MKKHAHSILRYFLIYALGFAVFYVVRALTDVVYGILSDKIPEAFPTYNPLTDKAELSSLEETLAFISAVVTVFVLTLLSVKYDNERFEFIISKTDGFYTLGEGAKIYAKNYLFADILTSITVPVPFFIATFIKIPQGGVKAMRILEDILGTLTAPSFAYTDKLGFGFGISVAISASLLFRIPAALAGLKRWRGLWLSDVDRGE